MVENEPSTTAKIMQEMKGGRFQLSLGEDKISNPKRRLLKKLCSQIDPQPEFVPVQK